MRAAISIWNDRVSPVMDTSAMLALYDVDEGGAKERGRIEICGMTLREKVDLLEKAGVELLVCGAVSNRFMRHMGSARIDLIPWVSGSIEMILEALCRGRLGPEDHLMPGCPRRRGRTGGGPGGGRGGRRHAGGRNRSAGGPKGRRGRSDIDDNSGNVDRTD